MKFIASQWLAAARFSSVATVTLVLAFASAFAGAATTPRYGGTLVVELHAPSLVLDPLKWKTGAPESAASAQIAAAVFDRLVTLDRFGRFQPGLATEWSHDAAWRRWQFTVRAGVQFSDGSDLSAKDVVNALQELLAEILPVKAVVTTSGAHVVLQFVSPVPDLLERLASERYLIYRRDAAGALLGTGAFFLKEFVAAASPATLPRYKLPANEHCWAGRPFADALEVSVGVPALRQLIDLQLGKADVVEISPELARRAAQENLHVWASAPVLLYALQVNAETPAPDRAAVAREATSAKPSGGEALSLALDRATMTNVLLQRQAEPAESFLPQWLSGYAFLFDSVFHMDTSVERAKETSGPPSGSASRPSTPLPAPLRLRVDASGDLAKLIAERVAINARQAGIPVQVQPHGLARDAFPAAAPGAGKTPDAGLRLLSWRYSSLSERAELDAMVATLQLAPAADEKEKPVEDTEQVYLRERRLIAERELIPLVVMPEYIGLGPSVRDWMAERWGEWHLADVWLDGKRTAVSPGPLPAGVRP